jgi:hypothetical protein
VTARNDLYAATDTAALYGAYSSPDKKLITVAGAAHGVDLLRGATGASARRDILSFLRTQRAS